MNKLIDRKEQELVWLPKKLAKEVKELNDGKELENMILLYMDQTKNSLKGDLDSIEESVIQYRGSMIKARNAFKEAKNAELDATYEMWEGFEKTIPTLKSKIEKLKNELKPLKNDIEQINDTLNSIKTWQIKDLVNLIEFFNESVYGERENILKFLLDNYKKEN